MAVQSLHCHFNFNSLIKNMELVGATECWEVEEEGEDYPEREDREDPLWEQPVVGVAAKPGGVKLSNCCLTRHRAMLPKFLMVLNFG